MSAAAPAHADIDTAIVRGEWWLRLFDELSDRGEPIVDALAGSAERPSRGLAKALDLAIRAVRLAVIAALRLDQILVGLAALRARSAAGIAAAQARARAKADEDVAARERRLERVRVRSEAREAREADTRRTTIDAAEVPTPERDTPDREGPSGSRADPRDRDPLVEALSRRLAAVDPAAVDFDDLELRELVLRICADLGVTADWARWEAGDWLTPDLPDTPATAAPVPDPPPKLAAPTRRPVRPPPRSRPPPVLPGLPGFTPRAGDTALSRVFQAGLDTPRLRPPRLQ